MDACGHLPQRSSHVSDNRATRCTGKKRVETVKKPNSDELMKNRTRRKRTTAVSRLQTLAVTLDQDMTERRGDEKQNMEGKDESSHLH